MSIVSANDTGLPDRRRILSTIAGVGALAVPGLSTVTDSANPDADLLALAAHLAAAKGRLKELEAICDDRYEDFKDPPLPESLFWRPSDARMVWANPDRLDGIGNPDDERFTYASDGVLVKQRNRLAKWKAAAPLGIDREMARLEEIVADLEAWEAKGAEASAACGYTAAVEAYNAQSAAIDALLQRMANTPAHTPEGVCIKMRAALSASYRSADLLDEHQLQPLLAKADRRPSETAELLSLSAMIDAARLGPTISGGRWAA